MPMASAPETSSPTAKQNLTIRRALAMAIVKSRREADATIKHLKEKVATLERECGRCRQPRGHDPAEKGQERPFPAAEGPLTNLQTTHDILHVVTRGAEALQQLGMQLEDVRFLAEVWAIQAASHSADCRGTAGRHASSLVPSASTDDSSPRVSPTDAAVMMDTGDHSLPDSGRPCVTGRCQGNSSRGDVQPVGLEQPWGGSGAQTQSDLAGSRDSLGQALGEVVDFLLHAVLPMQPGALQTSYAVSALSFIGSAEVAQEGPCGAFQAVIERLSSGLMSMARQAEAAGSEVAAGFLEELLELPRAGQTLFRVAAAELERAVAALADAGREHEKGRTDGPEEQIQAAGGVLEAALHKLPGWLALLDASATDASDAAQAQMSQAMEAIVRAHTLCEASCSQSAPDLAEHTRTLAVSLLTSLHCLKGCS